VSDGHAGNGDTCENYFRENMMPHRIFVRILLALFISWVISPALHIHSGQASSITIGTEKSTHGCPLCYFFSTTTPGLPINTQPPGPVMQKAPIAEQVDGLLFLQFPRSLSIRSPPISTELLNIEVPKLSA